MSFHFLIKHYFVLLYYVKLCPRDMQLAEIWHVILCKTWNNDCQEKCDLC